MAMKLIFLALSFGAIYLLAKYNVPLVPACMILICTGASAFCWDWSRDNYRE